MGGGALAGATCFDLAASKARANVEGTTAASVAQMTGRVQHWSHPPPTTTHTHTRKRAVPREWCTLARSWAEACL
eukprot:scaffold34058_cov57-Phaeocystis_antarctica.AAC.2